MNDLQKKINFAIRLIRAAGEMADKIGEPVEVAYSGGKDSDVIWELARMSGVKYRAIYKNTTIDPPGTINHCKKNGVEIIRPRKTFVELLQGVGAPNRFRRFCCSTLKEYKVLSYVIIGVRRAESTRRAARYKEPEQCIVGV